MDKDSKIYVAGHKGLVGSAIVRRLKECGFTNILVRSKEWLDLRKECEVDSFFNYERPEYVFLCASKVGGILANSQFPADFISDNLFIQGNIIKSCFRYQVYKMMFFGSSCIYPKVCTYPIKESEMLSGYLEPTNDAYAIAKIAGIKMCQAFNKQYGTNNICVMPTNLYGINDNFNLTTSHLIPALMRKFHEAKIKNEKSAVVWGSGAPLREIMFADDLADACLFLMENYDESEIINIGTGKEFSIKLIAEIIKEIVGFDGELVFDTTKPDGTLRKIMDSSKLNGLGWEAKTDLRDGLKIVYDWYLNSLDAKKN